MEANELKFTNCPIVFDWCEFKGEVFFAGLNYERSVKAKRPMIDLFHCATTALNGYVLKTVQFDKKKFKKSKLSHKDCELEQPKN